MEPANGPFGPYYDPKDEGPPLVWPTLLQRPSPTNPLVYLDMNHWISLAQACTGHPAGERYRALLEDCRARVRNVSAAFVLSSSLYMEMEKIRDPSQRRDVAEVMEELTQFATLVGRATVMELELDAAVARLRGSQVRTETIELLGRGVRHAMGLSSGFVIRDRTTGADVTALVRSQVGPEYFDQTVASGTLDFERSVLRGPSREETQEMLQRGWDPDRMLAVAERRAAAEVEFARTLDSDNAWRRGRLRDAVSARELIIEFQNILPRVLNSHGVVSLDELGDITTARHLVRGMPSSEVSIELKTAWHRNSDRRWTSNDVFDIDALAVAVPYCDIVVTEKACHHLLTAARIPARMKTTVLRRLDDLPTALAS